LKSAYAGIIIISHTCTLCYHSKPSAFLYGASINTFHSNAMDACLEINVKMNYNNIWLLWQHKLRLWVVPSPA